MDWKAEIQFPVSAEQASPLSQRPDRLCYPPSLLSNGYRGIFPQRLSGRRVNLSIHLHLVPKLRMRGAILSLPQYVFMVWCLVKQEISLHDVSRTALGSTQPPIQLVTGALSLGVKQPGREADHSPPSSAENKNAWRYTSTPPILLHGVVLS
jgi:hypothetical protein